MEPDRYITLPTPDGPVTVPVYTVPGPDADGLPGREAPGGTETVDRLEPELS